MSNYELPPLSAEDCLGADRTREDSVHRYGIWLPRGEETGRVQVDYWGNDSPELDFVDTGDPREPSPNILRHTRNPISFDQKTALGGLLRHLGIEGQAHDTDLMQSAMATFPAAEVLAARVASLNETLPEEEQFPTFMPYDGAAPDARSYLQYIVKDQVPIATGHGVGGNANIAALDMTSRIPFWLVTPMTLRQRLERNSHNALATGTEAETKHHIVTGISSIGLNGVLLDRFSSWRQVDRLAEGQRDREAAMAFSDDIKKRVQFLRTSFSDQ